MEDGTAPGVRMSGSKCCSPCSLGQAPSPGEAPVASLLGEIKGQQRVGRNRGDLVVVPML